MKSNMKNRMGQMMKIVIGFTAIVMLAGCCGMKTPTMGVNLPEKYNTPDGMVLDSDGSIILSMPNFNDDSFPAKILRIDKEDRITEVFTPPVSPETGKACPLGIEMGPDGNIYYADNQSFGGDNSHKSRLMRVNMKDGKAVGCDVLVTGFIKSNAVSCYGDSVYVTETAVNADCYPLISGVYRFKLSEFKGEPIALKPGLGDAHLITTTQTWNKEWPVGANGLGFDKEGNMYYCNFGEAQILKVTFDEEGNVASQTVVAEGNGMKSTDGMKICPKSGKIVVADFVGNAVHVVCPKTGKVRTIAENGNTNGSKGALDKPSEVCMRDGKIYVSNIDLDGVGGNTYDAPYTVSVIKVK